MFNKDALLAYAPITRQHVGPPGMSVMQVCEAAIAWSDNTAANLLLGSIGGPAAVTRFARSLGDQFTVVDRIEPALNPYDTTTPNAMLGNMPRLLLGHALSQSSREQLTQWLTECQTGLQSLRAGMPGFFLSTPAFVIRGATDSGVKMLAQDPRIASIQPSFRTKKD